MGFPFKAKHLYLLALFQLVGGPIVLFSVLLVGKTVVLNSTQHDLPKALASVLEKETWNEVNAMMTRQQVTASDEHQPQDVPVKKTDLKPAFLAVEWQKPLVVAANLQCCFLLEWTCHFRDKWTKAPPGPPPRWV